MQMKIRDKILEVVNVSDYQKGKSYWKNYINYLGYHKESNGDFWFEFEVESERSYNEYAVKIIKMTTGFWRGSCTCPQYRNFSSCKHLAACLYNYGEEIIKFNPEVQLRRKSLEILNSLKDLEVQVGKVREELKLEVSLEPVVYDKNLEVKLRIGKSQLYVLNNKMRDFLEVYQKGQGTFYLGKNFTYDPSSQYFNKTDEAILDYFVDLAEQRRTLYSGSNYYLDFSSTRGKNFLKLLQDKKFAIVGLGMFEGIKEETPFEPIISKKEGEYYFDLNLEENELLVLTNDFEYIVKGRSCYRVTKRYAELIKKMLGNGLKTLVFEEKDLPLFSKSIVPIVKEEIVVDESVDNLVIIKKPSCQFYFDIYYQDVICNIKLIYGELELDYFENNSSVVRDVRFENELVQEILELGFKIEKEKFILDDIDLMGEFFEYKLEELALKYEVYTSEKMKETRVVRKSNVSSNFVIGTDNIMSFSFDLGEISAKELATIFDDLKRKKKYFKLKNGNILNLDSDDSLRELGELAEELNLSTRELAEGEGVIPKYRAIYLDSLKKEKYHIIKTNNLFDRFMDNFYNYKDQKVQFKDLERNILRDYQVTGVEWLYNIHKCDLGAILADEMGLGKSIQVIYFFKKLLEEQQEAKFLIVAPTSLVYNWKEEFDKFAPQVKYEILATGRERRHELLEETTANVYITSYGLLREDLEIYQQFNFKVCVIDEAQNIKNPLAGITKAVKKIKAATKIALTGTPIENSVVELWSIFDYIMPGFFASQNSFQSKYKVKEFDEETDKLLVRLNKQIEPFILRRKKQDVLQELPEKIENNIYIDLSSEQKKIYAAEVSRVREEMELLIQTEGFRKARFMILQLLTKLRQLCIDPRIIFSNYKGGSTKIDNLLKIVQELIANGHKILLFSSFKTAIEIVAEEFEKQGISYYEINGSVGSKKRMELVNKFNQDATNVFLITLKAGGTGLNLTAADTVIHLDLWWNPQAENQATDRAHRIGQKNKVSVVKLVARGTIEEKILELQEKKKILSEKIIDGDKRTKNTIGELTEKDLRNLLSYEQEENS